MIFIKLTKFLNYLVFLNENNPNTIPNIKRIPPSRLLELLLEPITFPVKLGAKKNMLTPRKIPPIKGIIPFFLK